jgi:hypothetical protein
MDGGDCPRKFEINLVDVPQSGNASFALSLSGGQELTLDVPEKAVSVGVTHNGKILGYLPPQHSVVADCIRFGWKYRATLVRVAGDKVSPTIRVLVVGSPG